MISQKRLNDNQGPENVLECEGGSYLDLQYKLLEKAKKLVKINGTLIFAVCSFNKKEGVKQIEKFLLKNKNFQINPIIKSESKGFKKLVTKLEPENRFYPITNNFTTEASIHSNLLRDLYIVLGEGNLTDGWTVRIYYNPLVIWIWIGSLIIFFGGAMLTIINIKKIRSQKL